MLRLIDCPPAIAVDAIRRWLDHVPDTVELAWPLAICLNADAQVQVTTAAPGVMWFVKPDEAERVTTLRGGAVECTRWRRGVEIERAALID